MGIKTGRDHRERKQQGARETGKLKGSYTVEAALIVSVFVLLMAFTMHYGFELYQEIAKENEEAALEDLDSVSDFYQIKVLEEVFSEDE